MTGSDFLGALKCTAMLIILFSGAHHAHIFVSLCPSSFSIKERDKKYASRQKGSKDGPAKAPFFSVSLPSLPLFHSETLLSCYSPRLKGVLSVLVAPVFPLIDFLLDATSSGFGCNTLLNNCLYPPHPLPGFIRTIINREWKL
jgi:hypothetical protein